MKGLVAFGMMLLLLGCNTSDIKIPFVGQRIIIGIQPLGDLDLRLAQEVSDGLAAKYGYEVCVLPAKELPAHAYTEIKKPRYRADTIIHWLRDVKPDSIAIVLGLTNKDISVTKYSDRATKTIKEPEWKYRDFGIFGLGFRPGNACVVSTYRLKKKVATSTYKSRLAKVCWHEVGHNLGLKHCPTKGCFMQDAAETIKTVDNAGDSLCNNCVSLLPNN